MRGAFLCAFALAFLAAQWMSLAHVAKHALDDMDHNGQRCESCLLVNYLDSTDTVTADSELVPLFYSAVLRASFYQVYQEQFDALPAARGPPILL